MKKIQNDLRDIEELLATENITEEEAKPLEEAKAMAEALLDIIRENYLYIIAISIVLFPYR